MRAPQNSTGAFQKVGECLYRYSNGVYYARIRVEGKEIKRSLETTDPALARRKLADFRNEQRQIDRSQGKLTLDDTVRPLFSEQFGIRSRKPLSAKPFIVRRIKSDWPTGKLTQVGKIRPSECDRGCRDTVSAPLRAICTSRASKEVFALRGA